MEFIHKNIELTASPKDVIKELLFVLIGEIPSRPLTQTLDSPDYFGASFVDLHVHHTARADVRCQVDLRELSLVKQNTFLRLCLQQTVYDVSRGPNFRLL